MRIDDVGMDDIASRREAWSRVEHAMTRALTAANRLTMTGRVGLAYGHGSISEQRAWVDLAPHGVLRVDREFFEEYARVKDAGAGARRGLNEREQLFEVMGWLLREGRRVRRIDLYTCAIGQSHEGRAILDWIHHFWEIPIRGLRGDLEVSGNRRNPSVLPRVRVIAPHGAHGRGFGREWTDQLIDDATLWRMSRRRRPRPAPSP